MKRKKKKKQNKTNNKQYYFEFGNPLLQNLRFTCCTPWQQRWQKNSMIALSDKSPSVAASGEGSKCPLWFSENEKIRRLGTFMCRSY